jgi:hypothetical protein
MTATRIELSRPQILAFRRHVGSLNERLPMAARSLRLAAWAGLQDSMPRAALLSLHARVAGADPSLWEHPSLVQLWGPRFSNFVVAAKDLPIFSLGRLPLDVRRRARAEDTASRLHEFLDGRRMPFGVAGRAMSVPHNSLRYAAPTGTLLMRWDGARQPDVWTVPAPKMDPQRARLELARRYLHVFGPTTVASFADWAGVPPADARATWQSLAGELTPVRTPIGDAYILSEDEANIRAKSQPPPALARLLPSGDAYYLLQGVDRKLLVPETRRRAALWTSRVWPGALLVSGEIAGVWRRASAEVTIETWRRLSSTERESVEAEALSMPLPSVDGPIGVRWGKR